MYNLLMADFTQLSVASEYEDHPEITGAFYVLPIFRAVPDEVHLCGIAIANSDDGMYTSFIGDDYVLRAADYFNELRQVNENYLIVSMRPNVEQRAAESMFVAFARRLSSIHGWDPDGHNDTLLGKD